MEAMKMEVKYTKLFMNNEFVDAMSKKTFPVMNPSTGKPLAQVAEADMADVDRAVKAAKMAFAMGSEWRMMSGSHRGMMMNRLADMMERDMKVMAMMESLNAGKTMDMAIMDMKMSVDIMRYFAGWADKINGDSFPNDGMYRSIVRKEPMGVVGQIIPWHSPMKMLAMKWGPALATGCTLVIKPADQTPLTALMMAALAKEAGFPQGVINVLPGMMNTAMAMARHPDIRMMSFAGSHEMGHMMMETVAKSNMKKMSMELSGKSPMVIFDDVDVDEAVEMAHQAAFMNQGNHCCSGMRTYVQAKIYDEFVRKATAKAKAMKVGNPLETGIMMGPQIDKKTMDMMMKMVEMGKKEGAKLMTGGNQIKMDGYFMEPTVFSDVMDNMTMVKEEMTGPMMCIMKFMTMEEVMERVNSSKYGLAAAVMTKDMNRSMVFSQAVEAGMVWINTFMTMMPYMPFGGYKQSGMGRDMGKESLDAYLETKSVVMKMPMEMMDMMRMMSMSMSKSMNNH